MGPVSYGTDKKINGQTSFKEQIRSSQDATIRFWGEIQSLLRMYNELLEHAITADPFVSQIRR